MKNSIITEVLMQKGIDVTGEQLAVISYLWKHGETSKEHLLKNLVEKFEMNKISFGRMISNLIKNNVLFTRRRGEKNYVAMEETFATDLVARAIKNGMKIASSKIAEVSGKVTGTSKFIFKDSKEFAKEFGDEIGSELKDLSQEIGKVSKKGKKRFGKFLKDLGEKIAD